MFDCHTVLSYKAEDFCGPSSSPAYLLEYITIKFCLIYLPMFITYNICPCVTRVYSRLVAMSTLEVIWRILATSVAKFLLCISES